LKVDSSRARAHLGWAPRWNLERTLEAVVEWYAALRDGADMRAVTLAQLEAFTTTRNTLTGR
jgi:CDP-glucose 4,6-dehydratase